MFNIFTICRPTFTALFRKSNTKYHIRQHKYISFWWMPSSGMWRCVILCEPAKLAGCFRLVAQSAATYSSWFLASGFFYPDDGGDTFLRNVGSHKIYTSQNTALFIVTAVKTSNRTYFILFVIYLIPFSVPPSALRQNTVHCIQTYAKPWHNFTTCAIILSLTIPLKHYTDFVDDI
jgi:hypothetical protein